MARGYSATTDLITIGTPKVLPTTLTGWTIACWTKITSQPTVAARFIFQNTNDGVNQCGLAAIANTMTVSFSAPFATTNVQRVTSTTLSLSTWTFIFCTWDGLTNGTGIHIYFGTPGGSLTEASYGTTTNAVGALKTFAEMILGNRTGGGRAITGSLAHVYHACRVVPVNEGQLWMQGRFTSADGFWPLWGYSPEPDLSGNTQSGTLTGTTVSNHAPVGPYVVAHRSFVPTLFALEEDYNLTFNVSAPTLKFYTVG